MFVQENENGLIYMRSDILPFRHLFSTRFGGVSEGEFASLNILGGKGDRPENVGKTIPALLRFWVRDLTTAP